MVHLEKAILDIVLNTTLLVVKHASGDPMNFSVLFIRLIGVFPNEIELSLNSLNSGKLRNH